jgi:hypothetical protein
MKRGRIAAIGATGLLLAGCAGSSGGSPTTEQQASTANPRLAHRAIHYLHQNFKGTTWLGDVKRVRVHDGQMFVVTDLYPDSDADEPSKSLCAALRFWPPAPKTVHIVSTTGKWIGC